MNILDRISPLAVVAFIPVMWYAVIKILLRKAGMADPVTAAMGVFIREPGWGSAVVNGVTMNTCVKLAEYDKNWLLRTMPLFGGGKLWLPREWVELEPHKGGWFRPNWCEAKCEGNRVALWGRLMQMLE